jgi:ATP-dependent protease HslVU (ClpYQ) peptidase subunit
MTTIVGVETKKGFILAADSQTTEGERAYISKEVPKIVEVGEYVICGAGTSRYCDIVTYGWEPPTYDGTNLYKFMVSKFIPAMRKIHEETGYVLKDDDDGAIFLVGLENKLFYICEDYSVLRTDTKMYAMGTGGNWALGALHAGATVEEAMKIAIKLDINSGGKIQIIRRGE